MITFSQIGHYGRLGNQMFQFAATLGIGRKLGYEVKFHREFDVPKLFKLSEDLLIDRNQIDVKNRIIEPIFHFEPGFFSIPDSVDLMGYFQTEKYFDHIEKEVKELFTFNSNVQDEANSFFPKLDYETVSIHLRRGDYVDKQNFHPVCPPEYYANAVSEFSDKNYYFIVFSDDIEYCKDLFGEQDNVLYLDNKDPYVDLCLMTMCDHNIIANSTYSWWAAWLNKNENKRVIAPRKWFGPSYSHYDTKDLYCKNWKII